MTPTTFVDLKCAHCGDKIHNNPVQENDKTFCCKGCATVFNVLHQHGMDAYYNFQDKPGISKKNAKEVNYDYLEVQEIQQQVYKYQEGNIAVIAIFLPQIHCSACIWLLENLYVFSNGIQESRVDFLRKVATIRFDTSIISLKELAYLLAKIGYEPDFKLDKSQPISKNEGSKKALYKLGVAGFAFGNIMLLSFPEYLGFTNATRVFWLGYLNILLSIPVLFYSGKDYITSAWKSIKIKQLNLDIPVAIGMITLFTRSVIDIFFLQGEGYLDSLAGFVFFLLIGKWYQSYTYKSINFDRNFTSYFPIHATIKKDGYWKHIHLENTQEGDIVLIRNQEIIPGDGIITKGNAKIDYSYVTGEEIPIHKTVNDKVYAGGRLIGSSIEVTLLHNIEQSSLIKLWENDIFQNKDQQDYTNIISNVSKFFTPTILSIALITLIYWLWTDPNIAFETFTAVLIVACPCALALTVPFTYGNILRILSGDNFYLKNVHTIEKIQGVDHIVFDKTGTLTSTKKSKVTYSGKPLNETEMSFIAGTCLQSSHPLSVAIYQSLENVSPATSTKFEEVPGQGIRATFGENYVKIGSEKFILGSSDIQHQSQVLVEINGQYRGAYKIEQELRAGVEDIIKNLASKYKVLLLSGDNEKDKERFERLFGSPSHLKFNQSPQQKLDTIRSLQKSGYQVMMIGDGLNDAGALKQSEVGIVITDEGNSFNPACEGVLASVTFDKLQNYITFIKASRRLIYLAFIIALLYNTIGLYFAVVGALSPIIAAIIMPTSSLTIIAYGLISSKLLAKKYQI